jgi:transaldolase/glucose-6-phosphate isomerase
MADKRRTAERDRAISWGLGAYQDVVDRGLAAVRNERIIPRIWAHDHTVWKPNPLEIKNRLGWLHSVGVMSRNIERLTELADAVRAEGCTHAIVLGMGGSSLAAGALGKTFGPQSGYPEIAVLDSTDPGAVLACGENHPPARSLFIVSTKSGTTVETLSFFKFFYNRVADLLGEEMAGQHFVAITDPGSPLVDLAERYGFRATFLNDPNIGGRYSAISCFGLVPGALHGIDLELLLNRAMTMSSDSESSTGDVVRLGVVLGEMAMAGRDKITLVASPGLESFGEWVEQLLAESTGKEGRGILPVVGESLGSPEYYANDRLFIYFRLAGDTKYEEKLSSLERAGHPVVTINLENRYDLGGQFFLWEMATAVAGWRMGINPFDQPDVESAKVLARRIVDEHVEKGSFPEEEASLIDGNITVFGGPVSQSPERALASFIGEGITGGAYIALQAYLQPGPEIDRALHHLRMRLRDRFGIATTSGYGPRLLHSTGQLHKGDAGRGLFVQFTADDAEDVPIPDTPGSSASSMTFGVLKKAQAAGDRKALQNAGRQVIRFHLGADAAGGLIRLTGALT